MSVVPQMLARHRAVRMVSMTRPATGNGRHSGRSARSSRSARSRFCAGYVSRTRGRTPSWLANSEREELKRLQWSGRAETCERNPEEGRRVLAQAELDRARSEDGANRRPPRRPRSRSDLRRSAYRSILVHRRRAQQQDPVRRRGPSGGDTETRVGRERSRVQWTTKDDHESAVSEHGCRTRRVPREARRSPVLTSPTKASAAYSAPLARGWTCPATPSNPAGGSSTRPGALSKSNGCPVRRLTGAPLLAGDSRRKFDRIRHAQHP